MRNTKEIIPLCVPLLKGNEWKYVKECLDTNWVSSSGTYVQRFEEKICQFTKTKYAVACVNGTAALHIALRVAGVNTNDEVIVPTLTFIAPINAVSFLGAIPVFIDCDEFYNIDIEKTIKFILENTIYRKDQTINKTTGRRIACILPVHVFGNAVNIKPLTDVCKERNIQIVEDATESLGTYYLEGELNNKFTGTVGDLGCFSFNGNKIITTGGGGMIVTDNEKYARQAKYLTTQAKDDPILYIHNDIGYNYRLTNIQAAIGLAQMERLAEYVRIKKKNYETYKNAIKKIKGLHLADGPAYANNNCWLYAMQIDSKIYGKKRDELRLYLFNKRIETRPVWQLNHLQKPYGKFQKYNIENAYRLLNTTLNIPSSVGLTRTQINTVIERLRNG